jgi:glutathione S-transferase
LAYIASPFHNPVVLEFKEAEMRKLLFTTGSPFARAVRIVLVEKGLDFEREETVTTPSVEDRAKITPTLQVPALIDGELTIWDSAVIIDYLMTNYPGVAAPEGMYSLAADYVRVAENWHDKLVLATLLTFGESTTTVSQLQWSGIRYEENGHAARCAIRNQHLLDWFEAQLISTADGFIHGLVSAQDIFLTCLCQFIENSLAVVLGCTKSTKTGLVGCAIGKATVFPTGSRTLVGARGNIRHCRRSGMGKM